jgi:hypothetical protein
LYICYCFQVLSKDVAKTKQLLVGASGTEEAVQLRSSQKKQGKQKQTKVQSLSKNWTPEYWDKFLSGFPTILPSEVVTRL